MNHPTFLFALSSLAATAALAFPEVTSCTMAQPSGSRTVTIEYTLSEPEAVVTLDIQTNCVSGGSTTWASIGGEFVCCAQGAVWRKVTVADQDGNGKYAIAWDSRAWHDPQGNGFVLDGVSQKARAVVTAWALDNTPDYMVVDLTASSSPDSQKYYVSADFLAGGLLANDLYRTSTIVMRKITAKDVEWTMGSTTAETVGRSTNEVTHLVTLPHNYYIGVFEVTQAQWETVKGSWAGTFVNAACRAGRPVETVSFTAIRNTSPAANPDAASFLGIARSRTGLDFDIPSEAQWEFACRAGNGDMKWGSGARMTNQSSEWDAGLTAMARYHATNSDPDNASGSSDLTKGTAKVGSYKPNSWGLYDMHGNVAELCLDWFEDDITAYGGAVNVSVANQANTISGKAGSSRVARGGSWGWGYTSPWGAKRPASRRTWKENHYESGFRVVCGAGLE